MLKSCSVNKTFKKIPASRSAPKCNANTQTNKPTHDLLGRDIMYSMKTEVVVKLISILMK